MLRRPGSKNRHSNGALFTEQRGTKAGKSQFAVANRGVRA